MEKFYGFVWHTVGAELVASEGSSGAHCTALETESENEVAAETIMHVAVLNNMARCEVSECEHALIVTNDLRPKMIRSGMTANMREITTPADKRELVLRSMSALGHLTEEQLSKAFDKLPQRVTAFLDDTECSGEPDQEEIETFDLGGDFLSQEYPQVKGIISR